MRASLSRLWPSRGFTLAELLVVVIVVGVLAAIAVPLFLSQRASAEDAAAQSAVRNLASAQELFYTNNDGVFTADEVALAGQGFVGSDKVDVDVLTGGAGDAFVVCAAHQNDGDVWAWSSAQPTVQPVGEVDFGLLSDIDGCDPAVVAPSAPQNVTITPGVGQLTVSWDPPDDDGGSSVSYAVTVDPADAGMVSTSDTSTTITGLTNGKTYTVSVVAFHPVGDSPAATATGTTEVDPLSALQDDIDAENWGAAHYGGFLAGVIDTSQSGAVLAEDDFDTRVRYALIVSDKSLEGTGLAWQTHPTADVDGVANTMWDGLTAQNTFRSERDLEDFPAFNYAHNISDDGGVPWTGDGYELTAAGDVSRWYLPALDELYAAFWHLKPREDGVNPRVSDGPPFIDFPDAAFGSGRSLASDPQRSDFSGEEPDQTGAVAFQDGGDQQFAATIHLSASFASDPNSDAWGMTFFNGAVSEVSMTVTSEEVRPFRRVVLDPAP